MQWAFALESPQSRANIRQQAEDFAVTEVLGFEPSGEGQHRMLWIEKRNTNTDWLARQLARFAGVSPRDVGYAGLKDRHAITQQWFSLDLAGREEPQWDEFNSDDYRILNVAAHNRKIRKGTLQGNRFRLTLRNIEGDPDEMELRLQTIARDGVPNYFGEQRFGRDGDNINQAWKMLQGEIKVKDRTRRGLYLSAARSLLFNAVLSERVLQSSWNRLLPGEAAMLAGSQSFFSVDRIDDATQARLEQWDIHPSGPLWGRGQSPVSDEALRLEQDVLSNYRDWLAPLENVGLKQERRPLRLQVHELEWQWKDEATLELQFQLEAGSYATSVLRELCLLNPS
ncbi:MAG: tRNA pseudouridine(13) synthase TruD [Gammaproteobacteria bacterium]|nr:tRNA pseudouridine(13) synthase TruD [Gammaproteobacteria bacterium]